MHDTWKQTPCIICTAAVQVAPVLPQLMSPIRGHRSSIMLLSKLHLASLPADRHLPQTPKALNVMMNLEMIPICPSDAA